MFSSNRNQVQQSNLAPLAESLADVLIDLGDRKAASTMMALIANHGVSDGLALRRAEQGFLEGDATSALDALIPAWESGSDDLQVEIQMGLASLALGLYDVVDTLTDRDEFSLEHCVLRWIACLADDVELPAIDFDYRPTIWSLATALATLARCGRTDIVYKTQAFARDNGQHEVLRAISRIPSTEPISSEPASPPLHGRECFRKAWTAPGADVAFNWIWSSARQVYTGERVCVVSPQVELMAPFVAHARAQMLESESYSCDSADAASNIGAGRFEHIISVYDLNYGIDPLETLRRYARGLTHEGMLHLMVAQACQGSDFDVALAMRSISLMCDQAGLRVVGTDSRSFDGLSVERRSADVHLLQLEKRVI